jgi:hypothetical protein
MSTSPSVQGKHSPILDISLLCLIALLWLAAIFWAPALLSRFVPGVPGLLVPLWLKALRARFDSLGVTHSKLNLALWMIAIYIVCFLALYAAPKGRLLAPLAFVVLQVPLFVVKRRAIDPSESKEPAASERAGGPGLTGPK